MTVTARRFPRIAAERPVVVTMPSSLLAPLVNVRFVLPGQDQRQPRRARLVVHPSDGTPV